VKRSRCALISSAILVLLASPVSAIIRHVPGDYATIQAAIDASVAGDIVEVACGTYQVPEIVMKSAVALRSATGQADCVVLQPIAGPPPRRLLRCIVDESTDIVGVTFQDGYDAQFAPIYISGSPHLSNCKFLSNRGREAPVEHLHETSSDGGCTIFGAAIVIEESDATITDCIFSGNYSAHGAVAICGSPTFVSCQLVGNWSEFDGGAVTGSGGNFIGCTFDGNHAYFGGGAVSIANASFHSSQFINNTAGISGGAAIASGSVFDGCLFVGNAVGALGYAIDVGGGGLYVGGVTTINECTFWGNNASVPLVAVASNRRRPTAIYVANGAAIKAGLNATISIVRTVVNANTGSEAVYCESGAFVSISCSSIFGNPDGDWVGCIANQLGVNGNISEDPMFCDPENEDFYLSSLSLCLYADCGVMGAFGQGCFGEQPALFDVSDVGNDQGRQVRLTWQRSHNDSPSANPFVIGYGVYRKRDQFASSEPKTPIPQGLRGEGAIIPGWDYVGTVPSRGDSLYETVVPTLCDSTITDGQCLSTFFVSAMTSNPFVYWDSPPHSGYSKDNLAPPTPTDFAVAYNTGGGNQLSWDAVAAGDFAGFHIYRSPQPNGLSPSGDWVATTTQTTWTDPDFDGWGVHYEVTSFDVAGNESEPANAGTTTLVPSLTPSRLELLPNIPNPFNPSTTIRFTTPAEGSVRMAIFDARGSLIRVLIDKTLPAGHHDAVWDGRDGKGSPVSSGVYLCRLEQRSDFRARKIVLIK